MPAAEYEDEDEEVTRINGQEGHEDETKADWGGEEHWIHLHMYILNELSLT